MAEAELVLHATLRRIGGASSVLVQVITMGEGSPKRRSESVGPAPNLELALRERLVELLAPSLHVGSLWIEAGEGSEIFLDGESRGITPLDRAIEGLAPGSHLLRVVRRGGAEARSTVAVHYGQTTRLRIEPRSDQVEFVAFEQSPAASHPPTTHGALLAELPPDSPGDWYRAPALRWGLAGAGAVTLAAGIIVGRDGADLEQRREGLRDSEGRFPQSSKGREVALREAHGRRRTWSAAFLSSGGVLLVGAGTLFCLDWLEVSSDSHLLVQPQPDGLALVGSF